MATIIESSAGFVRATTIDKYGNTNQYDFRRRYGVLTPYGDGRPYTATVLNALWEDGQAVDWSPSDLTASERKQLKGFCDDCGTGITHRQVGPDEWEDYCEHCDELKATVEP